VGGPRTRLARSRRPAAGVRAALLRRRAPQCGPARRPGGRNARAGWAIGVPGARASPRPPLRRAGRPRPSTPPPGASLAPDARRPGSAPGRGALVVVANSKTCLGCTKRGTRRRATRTSGFRARMATPTGRGVLKARRKKGRKVLCTKTLYKKQ